MHIFDCDGVLLDSNHAKAQAFYDTAKELDGPASAKLFTEFHHEAGSLTRREQWQWFFREVMHQEPDEYELNQAVEACTERILAGVANTALVPGVRQYLHSLGRSNCICVSGITTPELRVILAMRGLDQSFTAIYGGPERKRDILRNLQGPDVRYYGDTRDDYQAANAAFMEFTWVYGYSAWSKGHEFFEHRPQVTRIKDFTELLDEVTVEAPTTMKTVQAYVGGDGFAYVNKKRLQFIGRTQAGATITLEVPG